MLRFSWKSNGSDWYVLVQIQRSNEDGRLVNLYDYAVESSTGGANCQVLEMGRDKQRIWVKTIKTILRKAIPI